MKRSFLNRVVAFIGGFTFLFGIFKLVFGSSELILHSLEHYSLSFIFLDSLAYIFSVNFFGSLLLIQYALSTFNFRSQNLSTLNYHELKELSSFNLIKGFLLVIMYAGLFSYLAFFINYLINECETVIIMMNFSQTIFDVVIYLIPLSLIIRNYTFNRKIKKRIAKLKNIQIREYILNCEN